MKTIRSFLGYAVGALLLAALTLPGNSAVAADSSASHWYPNDLALDPGVDDPGNFDLVYDFDRLGQHGLVAMEVRLLDEGAGMATHEMRYSSPKHLQAYILGGDDTWRQDIDLFLSVYYAPIDLPPDYNLGVTTAWIAGASPPTLGHFAKLERAMQSGIIEVGGATVG